LNGHIPQLLGSTTIAGSLFSERKATQSSRKTVVVLSTKLAGGNFLKIDAQSTSLIRRGLASSFLKGKWDLHFYPLEQIKRVRLVRRGDGYYVQFLVRIETEKVDIEPTGRIVGLDVGLKEFYSDSNGHAEPNPKFYRTGEKRLKFRQRRVSRKKKGSANRRKAINRLGRVHLKISGAKRAHASRLAT
jgi:putative transposase